MWFWRVLCSSTHVSKPQYRLPWKFRDHFSMLTYFHIGTMEWPADKHKNLHVEESSNLRLFTCYPNIQSSLLSWQSFAHHYFSIKLSSFLCRMQNVLKRTLDCKFQVLHIKVSSALTSCVALEKWLTSHTSYLSPAQTSHWGFWQETSNSYRHYNLPGSIYLFRDIDHNSIV